MLELSPRLHTLAMQVPQGAALADIGSDHAYLPVFLLKTGRIAHAIASDLRKSPLERGRVVASRWGIPDGAISFRCSDGLRGLKADEADAIVLAGMGGDTIAHCLDGVPWSRAPHLLYLIQPMSSIPALRLWLSEHGFCIEAEQLTREQQKLYVSLRVRPGVGKPLSLGEVWAGRQWNAMPGEHRLIYLDDLIARRTRALNGMQQARTRALEDESRQQALLLDALHEMKKEWLSWQL